MKRFIVAHLFCVALLGALLSFGIARSETANRRSAAPFTLQHSASQQNTFPSVARAECFPIERLNPRLRPRAEALLLEAMDGEALYTLVGGIKPMSSGWLQTSFDLSHPDTKQLDELRQIIATLRCGDAIVAHLHAFARPQGNRVVLEGAFFARPALRASIAAHQTFWNRFAITPSANPMEVLLTTEYAPTSARFEGYGYLFGYPAHAINFFVNAEQTQSADPEHKLVPRDFLSIPTFAGATHRFVYAVPKGWTLSLTDIALRQRCAPILAEYRRRRARYIGKGKPGIVTLLRDWFDNGKGRCSPAFARF